MVLSELAKNFLLYTSMTHDYFIPMRIIDWYLVKLAVKTKNGGNHTLLSAKNKSDQHLWGVGLINFTTTRVVD